MGIRRMGFVKSLRRIGVCNFIPLPPSHAAWEQMSIRQRAETDGYEFRLRRLWWPDCLIVLRRSYNAHIATLADACAR